ncbi:hypothetical protein GUJ93_ZPchr0015g6909 [Zizania palustris]|uniref:Stomatal closure-related actin-binding protein coiled-coil domain-containing protein n=1 Tax=Zizania palustris TaxID=103762 RepID=A0A8J5W0X1_ZIZPA|nr:hypothetical protein GUJ93_ZPchr0015g6909 [Zizania palustris]
MHNITLVCRTFTCPHGILGFKEQFKLEKGTILASKVSSQVEALAVQLIEREGDLIYEKAEVKKLASFLKQATKDALKVAEERALALREIEKVRVAIVKIEKGLQKHDVASSIREEAVLSQY